MTSEIQALLLESTEKMFSKLVDKELLDKAEQGVFPQELWQTFCDNGFHLLAQTDSGAELADVFMVIKAAGYYAAPLPLAEALLGNRWTNNQESTIISVGELIQNKAVNVPWSNQANAILAVSSDSQVFNLDVDSITTGDNIAFESRDSVMGKQTPLSVDEPAYELMALSRVCLASGALNRILELTIQYVKEREQFGRPIGKFQAVQHNLAVAAAEVAAATRSCDGSIESIGEDRFAMEVAAAKGRVGEAITVVTEIVHQLHGAMGFTHEHQLHHFTRRLWSWRSEFGDETYWQSRLGQHIYHLGPDNVWDFIATQK